MKLYEFQQAPNPRRVRIFMAEKGIDIPIQQVDLMKKEQFSPEMVAKNPMCDVPVLELEDGTCISQVNAILRYLEAQYPGIPLFGRNPKEIGQIEMWDHFVFMNGMAAIAEVFRNSAEGFIDRALVGPHNYAQIPALIERGQQRLANFWSDLDKRLADNEYVAGDSFSVADISALITIDFSTWIKANPLESHANIKAWYDKVNARPSMRA